MSSRILMQKLIRQPRYVGGVRGEGPVRITTAHPELVLLDEQDEGIILRGEGAKSASRKKVLVVGLVTNISKSMEYLKHFWKQVQGCVADCSFFYLTNNNKDNTLELLKIWEREEQGKVSGIVVPNEVLTARDGLGIGNRVPILARYRNKLVRGAMDKFGREFDYMLMLDTDLIENIDATKFLSCFAMDDADFDVICANGVFRNSSYHYDVFALRLNGEDDDINKIYPTFGSFYGRDMNWIDRVVKFAAWTRVKSAWGGMMLFNKRIFELEGDIYNENCRPDECEHLSACKKFERIFVNPDWSFEMDYKAEGNIYNSALAFVPRDAGFFSVFNFYIGSLMCCCRIYPVWNYDRFLMTNKAPPQHFCYFDGGEGGLQNAWFKYFKGVGFYDGDKTMENENGLKALPVSQGCFAPDEFRIPNATNRLLNGPEENLRKWRQKVNRVYRHYVKLSDELEKHVTDVWTGLFGARRRKVIGVHFRHPSHCCEQGAVMLADYFEKIDAILEEHKTAVIYLATDTHFGVLAFVDRYGSRVKYDKEITRTSLDNLLAWAFARGQGATDGVGFISGKGYELQHEASANSPGGSVKMGWDVLTDVMCLCKCDWFVHTLSNLALAVSYINPDLEMVKAK